MAVTHEQLRELAERLREGDVENGPWCPGDPPFYNGLESAADEIDALIESEEETDIDDE